MKKLALALVCLVSVAFFASCDPQEIVQELQPSIEVLSGEDYLQNGDVIDMYELRDYGFRCASNPTSQAELVNFKLTSTITTGEADEEPVIDVICDSVISGTEFTYIGELYFKWAEKDIVAYAELTATVTDATASSTKSASRLTSMKKNLSRSPLSNGPSGVILLKTFPLMAFKCRKTTGNHLSYTFILLKVAPSS